MIKIKYGDKEIEASVTPIILTVEKTHSQEVFVFMVNGKQYKGYVSKAGRLVVNSPKE